MSYPQDTVSSWFKSHVIELVAIAVLAIWCVVVTVD